MDKSGSNSGRMIGGVILIGIGLLALLGNMFSFDAWHYVWPFFVIGFGLAFFAGMFAGGKSTGALAIPGSIFTITGLLLFWQNAFNYYQSWAYAWALVAPMGVGIGMFIFSGWSDKPELRQPARILVTIGLILFVVGGAFFEMIFHGWLFGSSVNIVGPLLLIGLGVLILFGRSFSWLFGTHPAATNPPASKPQER